MKNPLLYLTSIFWSILCLGQTIDLESKTTVLLDNDTEVILYGKLRDVSNRENNAVANNEYYYLPPTKSLRLTEGKEGQPQFLFLKYAGNTKEVTTGGILYFTMQFGLTKQQEIQVQRELQKKVPNARVKGSVELMPEVGQPSGTLNVLLVKSTGSTSTLATSTAPIGQGGNLAINANLNNTDTQIIEQILRGDSNLGGLYVELRYTYPVRVPGFAGTLTFNQKKFQSVSDSFKRTSRQGSWHPGQIFGDSRHHSMEDVRKSYDYLREKKIIEAVTERSQYIDQASANELEKGFFNYFFETFAKPAELPVASGRSASLDSVANSKLGYNRNYSITLSDSNVQRFNRYAEHNLNHRIYHRLPCGFGNDFKVILNDINIDDHIQIVNFDDPLFNWRYINISLDAEVSDLIGENINSIEVQLRKKKAGQNAYYQFEDQPPVIFNQPGQATAVRTYNLSYDNEQSPGAFEYKTLINYVGGLKENSKWINANNSQLDIKNKKFERKNIELEADIDELIENRVTRVILQVRHVESGNEKTDKISLSMRESEALKMETFFLEKKSNYATRLVFYHKDLGRIIMPWDEMDFDDGYVYAVVPEQISDFSNSAIEEYNRLTNFSFTDKRDIQNEDGSLKEEIKNEAYDIFNN